MGRGEAGGGGGGGRRERGWEEREGGSREIGTNSRHWFKTSFLWRKVPESDARSVSERERERERESSK